MKPTPKGWPRLSTGVFYTDAQVAIDWLTEAFGFEVRLLVEGEGLVQHSELVYGEAVIMVGDERVQRDKSRPFASPKSLGGKTTQSVMIYVDDADAHCARARDAGARITQEPAVSDYGEEYWADKSYQAADHEGHLWWFSERVRG